MKEYPYDQMDFEKMFSTEEACRDYLVKTRWANGYRCSKCNSKRYWLTQEKLYQCVDCGHRSSITAGTIFQGTHKPLHLWFRAMWYLVSQKNGVSALGLQKILGLSRYETTWLWLHKLRKAMVRPGRDQLSGIVEVDETYVGGVHSGKRGRGAEGKELVLIAAEDKGEHIGRIRLYHIPNASAASIMPALKEGIKPGTIVRTDGWSSYNALEAEGYSHLIVRKSASIGDNLLPIAHRVASLLKRWIRGTHQGSIGRKHFDYYLDEYTFRFNRRTSKSRGKLFYRLIQQAVAIEPVTNENIRNP